MGYKYKRGCMCSVLCYQYPGYGWRSLVRSIISASGEVVMMMSGLEGTEDGHVHAVREKLWSGQIMRLRFHATVSSLLGPISVPLPLLFSLPSSCCSGGGRCRARDTNNLPLLQRVSHHFPSPSTSHFAIYLDVSLPVANQFQRTLVKSVGHDHQQHAPLGPEVLNFLRHCRIPAAWTPPTHFLHSFASLFGPDVERIKEDMRPRTLGFGTRKSWVEMHEQSMDAQLAAVEERSWWNFVHGLSVCMPV